MDAGESEATLVRQDDGTFLVPEGGWGKAGRLYKIKLSSGSIY
jgi:hypothetical protein